MRLRLPARRCVAVRTETIATQSLCQQTTVAPSLIRQIVKMALEIVRRTLEFMPRQHHDTTVMLNINLCFRTIQSRFLEIDDIDRLFSMMI
jgi:replication fork clamp-binding protein CrfC